MLHISFIIFCCAGQVFYVSVNNGNMLSISEVLFPGQASNLPQNTLVNMSFSCATGQLDVHIRISDGVQIIPQVLSLSNLLLSLRVRVGSQSALKTIIFSANTQLFSIQTFVAVKYSFETSRFAIKGIPTDTSSISMQNALQAVTGTSLKIPSTISTLSEVTFLGLEENGVATIAIKGKSNGNMVVVILQRSATKTTAAVIADLHQFNLASFINTVLNTDISSAPIFGTLTIPHLGFSATTGEITSSLLPQLYASDSPLASYGTTLPSGTTAHFTLNIASGVNVMATFSMSKFTFQVPKSVTFVVKQLLDQIPNFQNSLSSLPQTITDLLNSKITAFNFDPQTKELMLHTSVPQVTLIPNILKLMSVTFNFDAVIGPRPTIKHLTFSGTWSIGTVTLTTKVAYDVANKLLHVMASPGNSGTLSIKTLVKNIAGIPHNLPSQLTSLALSNAGGNVYNNGRFFVAMSGTIPGGKMYLLFYKGRSGVKVGIAASVNNFRLSDLVKSATTVDITSVPYFGSLVVPAMAIAITSGTIQSPTIPHLFGKGSPLLSYKDTLPTGVTSRFHLNIGNAKGVIADFAHGMISFKLPQSVNLNMQSLASHISGVSDAIQALPSQITSILNARIASFNFNSSSKDLSISGSLSHFTLVSGFLSISNVHISYDGVLGKKVTTRSLDFIGTWHIGDYSILTSIMYDGVGNQLTVSSQSQGGKQLSIANVLESLAGTTVPLPSVISSFTFTGLSGKMAQGTIVIVFSGRVGKGKISAVFEKSSSGSAGAITANIPSFKLAELVQSATGIDISAIPFFGSMVIPELTFAAATSSITSPLLPQLAKSGSPLEKYKNGLVKGTSGQFALQIGKVSGIAAEFVHKKLSFTIPDASFLSLETVLTEMPSVKGILQKLPSQLSNILSAKVTAFSYDPTSKELHFSGSIEKEVNIIPQFVSLSNVKISLDVVLGKPMFVKTLDFSGDWILRKLPIHTTVSYNREEKRLDITGELNTGNGGINIRELVTSLSGQDLPIPSVLSSVTLNKLSGNQVGDVTFVTLSGSVGHCDGSMVAVMLQKSATKTSAAVMADICQFKLASFVKSALNIDISSVPIFGTLTIPRLGFSATTGDITSSLLPQLYASDSPLASYGTTLPSGTTAHFTLNIASGVNVMATFSMSKFTFQVPKSVTFVVKQLLDQIPNFQNSLSSLPQTITDLLNSKITAFNFDPQTKELMLHTSVPQVTLIPNILKLTSVTFNLDAVIGPSPTIKHLTFSGTWSIGTVSLTTKVAYNGTKQLLHVMAHPRNSGTLSIESLVKNVAGVGHSIPSQLSSFSLSSVVGNIYSNGKFFVAMSGSIPGGKLYLLFYKGSSGVKVGIAANVDSFRLSDLVKSATNVDITSVPYFGSLVVPAMAIAITSGAIQSPTIPHLFGEGSPLLSYKDALPTGVTSHFHLNIGNAKGVKGNYANGVISFKLPKSVDLNIQSLTSHIPRVSDAIQALPSQITSILNARVASFNFNSSSKDLSISGSLSHFTLVSGFLSISNVHISYDGVLGKKMTTRSLDFIGTWQIGDYSILTSVMYDGVGKQLTVSSQSQGGKQLSIVNVLESLAGTTVPLPSVISSFTFTGISGKMVQGTIVIVFSGRVGKGKISAVFEKSSSGSAGAITANIPSFKLAELVQSATGIDISAIPFFGSMVIPELTFAAATSSITSPLLPQLAKSGSPLEKYKNGLVKGTSGQFALQIGKVSGIAAEFVHKKLSFTIPDASFLSLETVLTEMPSVKGILQKLPSQLSSILSAKVTAFSYDPTSKELHFSGSIEKEVNIIPQFVSLSNVKISLDVVLGKPTFVKTLDFSGDWILRKLPIQTTVSYNREEKRLDITGELNKRNGGIDIRKLISSLSGQDLPIPSVLSSVTLKKLSGNKVGDVTLVTLSGTVGQGNIYLIYQQSPSGSAIAFAADTPKFRFSSLVSSATGIDISSFPFFGTLVIPQIGFTISSNHISNPLLSGLYTSSSPLSKFGDAISKGVTATFSMNFGNAQGVLADYAEGELELRVPDTAELSLSNILKLIPGLQEVINNLPSTLQEMASARMNQIFFSPSARELQLRGSLSSLTIVPDILSLKNIVFEFSGVVGTNPKVKFASFKGDWVINSLALTTEVTYENILLIKGFPKDNKSLKIKDFIKGLTGTELKIPSVLNAFKFTQVIGKVQDATTSIVLFGQIGNKGKVSIVYQRSGEEKIVAFAADLPEFKLADLVKAGTGVDISSVPFFGTFTIPALSFVISSKQFSTALLPDLKVPGVPKELLLESIPEGVKGQFLADIGSAIGINVDYSDNILTLEVPSSVSLSLQGLLSVIPEIKSTIDALPSTVKDILNARITKLVFKPATKDLFVSLRLDSLTLVPKIVSMKDIQISLDVNMNKQLISAELQRAEMQKASISPYVTPFHFHSPATSASRQIAEIQAVSIESLQMKGKWVIRGIEIDTSVTYSKETKQIHIEGAPSSSNGLSVTDLTKALSGADLSVPSVISSLKLTKVVARSDPQGIIVILSATAGSADVYLVFQRSASGSATAIAADIEEFKLADVIKTATNIDVSGVPFIGSFVISTLAFSVSTNTISHALLPTPYDSDSPLQAYGGTLPKGLTAFFKAEVGGTEGIEVTYAQRLLNFKVPSNVDLSLQGLLSEIPNINSVVRALPSPLSDLLACNLVAIRFDPPSKTLSVAATFTQITIIPNVLQVRNLDISLVAILSSSGGLQSLDFNADWILRSLNLRIKVSYNRAAKEVQFAAIPKQSLNIRDLINSLAGKNLPIPSVISSVALTKVIGQKSGGIFTFIFSGSIAGKAGVHLVYQKFGATSHIAIAAGINSFKFADLVRSAVNIDITGIPFFGAFSVPSLALVIANRPLTTPLLSQVLSKNSPLARYGSTLPGGFTAKFNTPIHNIQGVIGSYAGKVLSFTVPPKVDVSLGALLSVVPGVKFALPSVFGNILKIRLKGFAFDIQKREMSIEMFMHRITFYENMLAMSNTHLKLKAKLSLPRSFSAEARGTITIGNTNYVVDLGKDPTTSKYVITVKTVKLPIFGIVKQIGAKMLPDDLNKILGQVFNFNILNARIVYPLGVQPQQILISGTPEIFGMKTVQMTAVAIRYGGKIRLIQKYNFGTFSIADFIKKLLGVSLHKLKILNQNANIGFIASPSTLKGISLSIPEFKGFSINRGITFNIPLGWPSGCESDAFCAVAKKLMGGAKLSLHATIANARSFSMTATIGNLKLGGGVVLMHAGLQIVSGNNPSVGVVGGITMRNPAITLTAAIRATAGGVRLEGSMSGCWNNAFGSPYLTICNILLAMSIVPSPAPISGLEIGGRVEVGKKSCGKVLTAEGYIGINVINPSENYFYANVGPITFQKFFDAFCLSVQLPRPLAESGFPKGFMASFSLLGKEIPHARISIPPGYQFKGTLNILGLEAYAEIIIQLPTRISVKAALPPLRIANVFKMYASSKDRSRGPYLIADISTRKAPSIEASGFVEVLGISAETKLLITTSKYEFSISGKFLNYFTAGLRITASYGSFSKASYTVEGWFKNDLFDKIAKTVRDGLKKSADEADRHISSAQNKIRDQKAKFDSANAKLQNAKRWLDDKKRSFDAATSKMEAARRKLNNVCHIKSCGSGEYHVKYINTSI